MGDDMVKGTSALKRPEGYTYADYKQWPEDERWELIYGEAWSMSPAPRRKHQGQVIQIAAQLDQFFSGKPCRPHIAPVDVFLLQEGEEAEAAKTVVQPDAFVVCDPGKLTDEGVIGAPDFIIEVLSPATAMKDQTEKRLLYEAQGVREYWIINPDTFELFIYTLKENRKYGLPEVADLREAVPVRIFEGLSLKVRPEDL
jgi:Uma2 family endonuclease